VKRTFRLIKDIPDFKAGLLVQEACEDGDQSYDSINGEEFCAVDDWNDYFTDECLTSFTRKCVETQPKWFEEVNSVYMSKKEQKEFRLKEKK